MTSGTGSRVAVALLASLALHAAIVAALESRLSSSGAITWLSPGAPLRAMLVAPPVPPVEEPAVAAAGNPQGATADERQLLPQPRYHLTRELDVRPGIMTRVDPEYPQAAARRFLSGRVVIRLDIDETGKVERVRTVKATPPGYFEQSAERAFRDARFTPGMKDGRAVKVRMVLEIDFDNPPPVELARGSAAE